jgi:transcriptional regulator with XRE-family HTH domain
VKSVGELVDDLFRTHRKGDGREYTYQEVSDGVDGKLDPGYIWKLRKGKIENPGRTALMLLCVFFRVPASYFFPELDDLVPGAEADAQIQCALRSTRLPADVQNQLQELIKVLRRQHKTEAATSDEGDDEHAPAAE